MRPTLKLQAALWRPFTVGVALVLGAAGSLVGVNAAHAGPDQDRVTVTRQHVDAPVPAWDASTKTLSILVNQDPADTRVLWLGRGWGGNTSYPIIKHLFSVPDDPQLSFLGDVGTTWLSAPQDPGPGNSPIWAGIGVDSSLYGASSQFEADNYVLDLVSVNGPGRMELFTRTTWGVRRSWSSHDLAYRTIFNPRHMHAFTTFSKPGRYEVNVAAVARDAKGKKVYTSRVTPVVWQVGGSRPDQGAIKDFRASFEQAPAERADGAAVQPEFTIAPKTNFQVVGDDFLTDFTFNTGNPADNGHLVVTIDGFYMNEVPVQNGVATFDEMIGDSASTFQAIYIPADETSARWASQPVEFSRLHKESLTVTEGTDVLVAEQAREVSPTLTPADQQVANGGAELTITPLEDGEYSVALRADEHLNATYKLGFYANKRTRIADCTAEGTLFKGQALFTGSFNYCKDHPVVRVSILPHPYANMAPVTLTVDNPGLSTARSYPLNLALRSDNNYELVGPIDSQQPPTTPDMPETPTPQPQPQPQPELPPIVEQPPTVQTLLNDPIELDKGHLDLRLVPTSEGGVTLAIKDDSLIGAKKSVLREPAAVTLVVPHSAIVRRNEQLKAPAFDFLGPVGTENYILPETQAESLVWPGFSTEGIDYSTYPQGIDYEVTLTDGPAKGVVSFVTTSGVGNEVTVRVRTNNPATRWIRTTESTHLHGAWVFSQPGLYRLSVRAMSAGKEIAPSKTLTFAVDRGAEPLVPGGHSAPPKADQPDAAVPGPHKQPEKDGHKPQVKPEGDKSHSGKPQAEKPRPESSGPEKQGPKKSGSGQPGPVKPEPEKPGSQEPRSGVPEVHTPKKQSPHSNGTPGANPSTPSSQHSAGSSQPAQQEGRSSAEGSAQGSSQNGVSHTSGGNTTGSQADAASPSRPRAGRIVDISRPSTGAQTSQSGAAKADNAQSADRPQSEGRTTVIRAADAQSGKQDAKKAQSAREDEPQSSVVTATASGMLGGYSPVTVGIILAAAIAAGAVIVIAVRKSLVS